MKDSKALHICFHTEVFNIGKTVDPFLGNNPDGSVRITRTTKVTGKGQTYFINRFLASRMGAAK